MASGPSVAILVPTFRRPILLAKLLDSIVPEVADTNVVILIGDNDCDAAIAALVAGYADRADIRYLAVADRGVSQVRNALVAAAMDSVPDWQWILMLDDDGTVAPGWYRAIISCGATHSADLVGGPVEGVLPAGAGALARNSIFARRRRWPTGRVPLLNTTQNLAIARSVLDRVPLPLFDSRYGASGGEDYDFFRRVARSGGALVWCDEAVVVEPAPAERLTTKALLHRYFSTGIYMAPIDSAYDGRRRGWLGAVKGLVAGMSGMLAGTILGQPDRMATGALMTAHHSGRLCGLSGARSARYVKTEGG